MPYYLKKIDLLIRFYVHFQLVYGYVETNGANDDDITETWPPSQGLSFFYILNLQVRCSAHLFTNNSQVFRPETGKSKCP